MNLSRRTFYKKILSATSLYVLHPGLITGTGNFISKKNENQPTKVFKDDFSRPTRDKEVYRFLGEGKDKVSTIPFYSNDGPGGAPSLNCRMPSELIPYKNPRSQINCLLRGTDFKNNFEMEWGVTYGYKQTFKLMSNGAENGYRCIFFQTHTPQGSPKGSSPLIGLQANAGSPVLFYINGDEKRLAPTDVPFSNSDIFDVWCTLSVDLRYNYGNDSLPPGFCRIYLTIGTSDAPPADPNADNLIHQYDGNIGFNVPGHGPGYFICGIYEVYYRKEAKTNETAMEMIMNRIQIQNSPFIFNPEQ